MSVVRRWVEFPHRHARQTGFTLFELIIVIVLVGLLFTAAWWRLLPLRGDAEAAHVATTIGTLRSALGLEITERIVEDSMDSVAELEHMNPMQLLAQAPGNYLGEVAPAAQPEIERGNWYFDPASGELRYRVRFPRYLERSTPSGPVDLAWRIDLSYRDVDGNGRFEAGEDVLRSIDLRALDNPGWPDANRNIPEVMQDS